MDGPALLAHYRAVADAVPRPVLIYSIPQCTGVQIPVKTLVSLSGHPNIAGLKESSGDLAYMRRRSALSAAWIQGILRLPQNSS